MIRLTVPSIDQDDLRAVEDVLASGYLVQGPRVAEFERVVADYVGVSYAVAVTNCTAALQLALLALDIQRGDKVAVTTYSWPATANIIELCGAIPVFVDVEPSTYNMDPVYLEKVLKDTSLRAIIPVHAFGGLADMRRIHELASAASVPIIEDAACALGTELDGRRAGNWGVMGCFSFHPRKAITTGEGGLITTNNPDLARKLRMLRNHGLDPETHTPDFVIPGFNVRLTEFQAALGISQMKKLDRIVEYRRKSAEIYNTLLKNSPLSIPQSIPGSRHVYQSYVCLLPNDAVGHRQEIITALKTSGVETTIGTYHMPLARYYRETYGFKQGDFPVTDNIAQRAISLPLFEGISEQQQQYVVEQVLAVVS